MKTARDSVVELQLMLPMRWRKQIKTGAVFATVAPQAAQALQVLLPHRDHLVLMIQATGPASVDL